MSLLPLPLAVSLLLAAFAARAGQVEMPVGEIRLGNARGAPSPTAPAPISLSVSPLGAAPISAAPLLAAPLIALPAAAPAAPPAAPVRPGAVPANAVPAAKALESAASPAAAAGQATPDAFEDAGRVFFDQAAPAPERRPVSGGFIARLKNMLSLGEAAPAWPGRAGEPVRVGSVKTTLDKLIGEGSTSKVWRSRNGDYAVKILHPQARSQPGAADEASVLQAIAGRDLPVAKLRGVSADGSVIVKDLIEGDSLPALLERRGFERRHALGWAELAAKLISNWLVADLTPSNLVWQTWRSRWMLVDAGGLRDGGPGQVLGQLLEPSFLAQSGLDTTAFLAGLRGRLGPDSKAWADSRAALKSDARLAGLLERLERADAAQPIAPELSFLPAPAAKSGFDDRVVNPSELNAHLGYDPLAVKDRYKLHGDDPGKLNTQIYLLKPAGRAEAVLKRAEWSIIRDELAARRLARRFFGRYFRVPASLGVKRGFESYMVMEKAPAAPSYYDTPLDLEQRVALALFVHTFGIGDVNPGNVLTPSDGGLPWLIDFEQAFSRHAPVASRLPDERIAQEMPWMTRAKLNRAEDYQPAIRAWRAFFARPETGEAIVSDLVAAGYARSQAQALLARFRANAADLDWTIQNDVDFVNHFVERDAARSR